MPHEILTSAKGARAEEAMQRQNRAHVSTRVQHGHGNLVRLHVVEVLPRQQDPTSTRHQRDSGHIHAVQLLT